MPAPAKPSRQLSRHEPTLRARVIALVALALIAGVMIGTVEGLMGHHVWPMMLGIVGVGLAIAAAAEGWVVTPLHALVRQAERLASVSGEADAPRRLRALPCDRADELGRLARCLHQVGATALEGQREARALRRDMTSQVDQSTRRATRHLYELAHRDALTGLGNRRCLDQRLESIVADTKSRGEDLLCVAIDMDNFKQVNDLLGHGRGDDALRCLGELLAACVRPGDLAVRLGGDEFVLLLPGVSLDAVAGRVRQVRSLFQQRMRVMLAGESWADLSIGVASMRRDGCCDGRSLLDTADAHLYKAKHAGKGQTFGVDQACDPREDGLLAATH